MREVAINEILYGFHLKNRFLKAVVLVQVFQVKTSTRYGPEILQLSGKIIKTEVQKC